LKLINPDDEVYFRLIEGAPSTDNGGSSEKILKLFGVSSFTPGRRIDIEMIADGSGEGGNVDLRL